MAAVFLGSMPLRGHRGGHRLSLSSTDEHLELFVETVLPAGLTRPFKHKERRLYFLHCLFTALIRTSLRLSVSYWDKAKVLKVHKSFIVESRS